MTIYKAQSPQQDWCVPGLIYTVHRPSIHVGAAVTAAGLRVPFGCIPLTSAPFFPSLGLSTLRGPILLILGNSTFLPVGVQPRPTPDLPTLQKPDSSHTSQPVTFPVRFRPLLTEAALNRVSLVRQQPAGGRPPKSWYKCAFLNAT